MLAQSPTSRANVRLASCKTRFKCLRSAFNINTTSLQHVPCAACPGGLSGDLTGSSGIKQHDADMQQPGARQQQQQQQQPAPQRPQEEGSSQQQEQGQSLPPAYDPQAAAGFAPPPGEKPLWWVEKFEARRRQLAEEQASAAAAAAAAVAPLQKAPAASSGSSSSSSGTRGELQVNAQTAAKAAVQIVQLLLVTAVLILWPASLHPGGLATLQIWMLYVVYMLFFAGGSLYRLLRYGELAPRAKDAQGRTWYSTAAWLLFVAAIPIIHWPPIRSFLLQQQQYHQVASTAAAMSHVTLYDIIGVANLASAVILNWWAARALGRAYDRVVRPEELVTCGPYAVIRHPIYTSYMLLFSGYAMLLHSASTAVFAVAVCVVYYSVRTRLEQAVLQEAFGETYHQYVKRTKMFLPFVW